MPKASSTVTIDYFYLKSPQAEQSACHSPSLRHTESQKKTWKHSLLILAHNRSKVLNPLLTSFWFSHSTFCLAGWGRFITSFLFIYLFYNISPKFRMGSTLTLFCTDKLQEDDSAWTCSSLQERVHHGNKVWFPQLADQHTSLGAHRKVHVPSTGPLRQSFTGQYMYVAAGYGYISSYVLCCHKVPQQQLREAANAKDWKECVLLQLDTLTTYNYG